jgi:hypothetical protein
MHQLSHGTPPSAKNNSTKISTRIAKNNCILPVVFPHKTSCQQVCIQVPFGQMKSSGTES